MPVADADVLERLAQDHGLFLCVECGKCAAVCPMGRLFHDYGYDASPRGVIERALLGLEFQGHAALWFCLTCELCTSLCPAGVRFRDYMEAVRAQLVEQGDTDHGTFCRECGAYLWPRHTTEHVQAVLGGAAKSHLTLCPRCRRHEHVRTMLVLAPPRRAP